jgi:adenylate cyclase
MSTSRRLAAIVLADIVGYSHLIKEDELGTRSLFNRLENDLFTPLTSEYDGRIIKTMGDAVMMEFSSVVNAVMCSIQIQSQIEEQTQTESNPILRAVRFRTGIHIGDIIVEGNDIHGDGVNVAARLEQCSKPGGICISDSVYEQIKGRVAAQFVDGGKVELKNIESNRQIYLWEPTQKNNASVATDKATKMSEKPSLAVLALTNMNHDSSLDYIGDGITEDLITALSKIRSFKVISRESTFSYKNKSIDIRKIAQELGVRYIMEGSVRKGGSRIRVTAQLIDAETGHHVWAEKYDREMEDIFDLQDEMVQIIAAALEPELYAFERERIINKSPDNLDAWELYQRGLHFMWAYEDENTQKAIEVFTQANQADPSFAPAYAYLAYSYYITVIMGYTDSPSQNLELGMMAARKALSSDPKDAMSHFAVARIHMMQGRQDEAISALETSIVLNPSFSQSYHAMGMALALAGRLEESKSMTEKAIELSPRDPMLWAFMAVHALTLILNHEYEESLRVSKRYGQMPNASGYWKFCTLASALGNLGQVDEAQIALKRAIIEKPGLSLDFIKENMPTKSEDGLKPYLHGLTIAGLT